MYILPKLFTQKSFLLLLTKSFYWCLLSIVIIISTQNITFNASVASIPNQNSMPFSISILNEDKNQTIFRNKRLSILVRRIQIRLAELRLYDGPIDGKITSEVSSAIRKYQQLSKLPTNGEVSTSLLRHLSSAAGEAQKLLNTLDKKRKKQILAAKIKIESVFGPKPITPSQKIYTSRGECLEYPTSHCLLVLARKSAENVERPDLRDWALSSVVQGFARIGDLNNAMITARSINDPRSIVSAIGSITVILAEENQVSEAIELASRLEDSYMRDRVNKIVADELAKGKNYKQSTSTIDLIKDSKIKFDALIKTAMTAVKQQNLNQAHIIARAATGIVPKFDNPLAREWMFGELALLYSALGDLPKAKKFIKNIKSNSDKVRVLSKLIINNIIDYDLTTSDELIAEASAITINISNRSELQKSKSWLSHVNAVRGNFDIAHRYTKEIEFGYTRDYTISRIAIAMGGNTSIEQAITLLQSIKDQRLKVNTLLTISQTRQILGDKVGAEHLGKIVWKAAQKIKNKVDKASVIADLAITESWADRDGNKLFLQVIKQLEKITDDWSRAKILTKAATTLYGLRTQ